MDNKVALSKFIEETEEKIRTYVEYLELLEKEKERLESKIYKVKNKITIYKKDIQLAEEGAYEIF